MPLAGAHPLGVGRPSGGRLAIEVSDRGTGIAAEDLPRVFEPYFTTKRTGTGLGLAIARNIVEGLGGSIVITSRLGAGTDIRIELPVGTAAPEAAAGRTAGAERVGAGQGHDR